MCFWGPNGMISQFLASARTAVTELCALVARQAAAILRLLNHLANLGGSGAAPMAIAADLPGGAPPALNLPSLPAAPAKPPPPARFRGGTMARDTSRAPKLSRSCHCSSRMDGYRCDGWRSNIKDALVTSQSNHLSWLVCF
jgi:hypothetical protein